MAVKKLKYMDESDPFMFIHGKIYTAISQSKGWYRVIDETGEDYLYPPELFEVVENGDLEEEEILK